VALFLREGGLIRSEYSGVPFKARVEVYRTTLKVYINDELVWEGEDEEDWYFEGMFGFRADNSAVEIRNLKVYQL